MKLLIVLFAVVAAVAAYPGWEDPWQSSGWNAHPVVVKSGHSGYHQPSYDYHQPYYGYHQPSYGYQHGYHQHHHAHHVDAIHVPQPHPIPPLHPEPLKLKVHPHVTKIHYDHPKVHHPHLIGHEVAHHEPEVKYVKHEVHDHGHGWA
ncbi:uncharacterized histidine-rich protein DDB_G0274557 [Microplitis demolitor]|uniref:uncharacterized histidine-rich protein DDB_G0274557 n=1 Tax=Microplitis demolitor TaxID=69319 RepID=UPI0004CD4CF4|nr:uncharacterized histidine-rich protein DDB_G0274557 [Microplitis demolitor]